jgi:hypothetical protein
MQGHVAPVPVLLRTIVEENPGIHFRGLGRAANLSSMGQLRHHVDRLGHRGELIEVQDGQFKRFFVPGDHDARVRTGLARFARRVPRRIGSLLLERAMSRTELRRSLNCADSTLGYHLSRMVGTGDVTRDRGRRCVMYSLADPGFVRQLLVRHAAAQGGKPATSTGTPAEESANAAESMAFIRPNGIGPAVPQASTSSNPPATSPTRSPANAPPVSSSGATP